MAFIFSSSYYCISCHLPFFYCVLKALASHLAYSFSQKSRMIYIIIKIRNHTVMSLRSIKNFSRLHSQDQSETIQPEQIMHELKVIDSSSDFVKIIKRIATQNLIERERNELMQTSDHYSDQGSSLLKWIINNLDNKRNKSQDSDMSIKKFLQQIQNIPQENIQQKIVDSILQQNSYLGNVMRKGFFYYLFMKYQTHNYTDNSRFVAQFSKDFNWFKIYFTRNIMRLFQSWIPERQVQEYKKYFLKQGIAEMVTRCRQWKIIYMIFLKCLGKYTNELNKEELQQIFKDIISYDSAPFNKTIQKMKKFGDEYHLTNKLRLLDQIVNKHLVQEEYKLKGERAQLNDSSMGSQAKLKYLQYCIFRSGENSIKSLVYIDVLLDVGNNNSDLHRGKQSLQSLKNAANAFLSAETFVNYKDFRLSPKVIQFRRPFVRCQSSLPFAEESIRKESIFTTMNSSKLTLFSVKPLVIGSNIKIHFVHPGDNNLWIGVCKKTIVKEQRKSLQNCESVIAFNTKTQKVCQNGVMTKESVDKYIYRVTLKVKNQTQIEWILNEENQTKYLKSFRRSYNILKQSVSELYACISFKHKTSFTVIDY